MPNSNRNRKSRKGNEKENRTGTPPPQNHKLSQNPRNLTENVSTAANEANPKNSRRDIRKDEK